MPDLWGTSWSWGSTSANWGHRERTEKQLNLKARLLQGGSADQKRPAGATVLQIRPLLLDEASFLFCKSSHWTSTWKNRLLRVNGWLLSQKWEETQGSGGKVPVATLALSQLGESTSTQVLLPQDPHLVLAGTSLPSLLAPGLTAGSLVNHRLSATRSLLTVSHCNLSLSI